MTQPTDDDVLHSLEAKRGPGLASDLNTHTYPELLHSSPRAYRLFQLAVHATTLRSWYVRRAIRHIVRRRPKTPSAGDLVANHPSGRRAVGTTVLDLGCGSGDHLLYALRRLHKEGQALAKGIGLDRAADAIALCRSHANRDTLDFREVDLSDDTELPKADVILCITVLQYVREDAQLLARMRRALLEDGTLLLYVPVRNERLLPLYDRLVLNSGSDYDAAQDHHRTYQPHQVELLLNDAGFRIESIENAYGTWGKLAYELHALLLHGLTESRSIARALSMLGTAILAPAILTFMLLDYHLPVKRGNALLIRAQ